MRVAAILIASVWLAMVAGCGGKEEGRRGDVGSRPDASALAGPLVYERFGGSTGSTNRVRLQRDGRATFATKGGGERTVKLRPAELGEMLRVLARVDLAQMPGKFIASESERNPDTFGHEVTYQGETVYSEDDDDAVPDELGALTGRLSALFDEYAPERG